MFDFSSNITRLWLPLQHLSVPLRLLNYQITYITDASVFQPEKESNRTQVEAQVNSPILYPFL